jgi:hypothetical protein
VLLALTAVATAWSSYQANRWNGEHAKAGAVANASRIQAARAQGLANGQQEADLATFIQWVDAYATGNAGLQTFYETRFRTEFAPAFDAWIATRPFDDPAAPESPFLMPEYQLAAAKEAARLDMVASASAASAVLNIQRSSNYVLAVVLFAVALLFAGMAPRLANPRVRIFLLGVGSAIFVGTVTWLLTFPVTLSV